MFLKGEIYIYQFGNGLIKCLNCQGKYRGKKQRNKLVYTCTTYQKLGAAACTNYVIPEEELIHIVSTHLKLKGTNVGENLCDHIDSIEVKERGYRIFYKDGTDSIVNDSSSEYGTKFKY